MTGFGRAAAAVAGRRVIVEVRSVNHRGLDVKVRGRDLDGATELELGKAVRGAVERGAVVVTVQDEGAVGGAVNAEKVRAVHASLEALRTEMGLPTPVDLGTVAAFIAAASGSGPAASGDELWGALRPAIETALRELCAMRAREGGALAADLGVRLQTLRALATRLRERSQGLAARAARRLEEKVAALLAPGGAVDPARLAQEAALLAERLDVTEELTRLDTHLGHLGALFGDKGAVGRKIDFLIQEIGREINTIGSKVQDADIAALVIEAKAELEKIREQAQNIE